MSDAENAEMFLRLIRLVGFRISVMSEAGAQARATYIHVNALCLG